MENNKKIDLVRSLNYMSMISQSKGPFVSSSHIIVDLSRKRVCCETCKKWKDLLNSDFLDINNRAIIERFKIEHKQCQTKNEIF